MGGLGFLHADSSKSAVSGRIEKICKLGGEFLQAHVGNCPVADLRKSAYWEWGGGNSATRFQNYRFVSSTDFV